MIVVACLHCNHGLRISPGGDGGSMSELEALFGRSSEMYPNQYPCFNCGAKAQLIESADAEALLALELRDVNPQEAFAATNGLGLPEDHECSGSAVAEAMRGLVVKSVETKPIRNSHRCIVSHIEMADGTKLYLGSSAYGATVFRVSRPHSYAKANS